MGSNSIKIVKNNYLQWIKYGVIISLQESRYSYPVIWGNNNEGDRSGDLKKWTRSCLMTFRYKNDKFVLYTRVEFSVFLINLKPSLIKNRLHILRMTSSSSCF